MMRGSAVVAGALLWAAGVAAAAENAPSLLDAARLEQHDAAVALIEQRADVNQRAADGTTPLHWAAHHRDLDLVKRLIQAGAKVLLPAAVPSARDRDRN